MPAAGKVDGADELLSSPRNSKSARNTRVVKVAGGNNASWQPPDGSMIAGLAALARRALRSDSLFDSLIRPKEVARETGGKYSICMARRYSIRYIGDVLEYGHSIWASCPSCDRHAQLNLRVVIERHGPMLALEEVRGRVRCTKCGRRTGSIRVVYRGDGGR